ncbi:MAG: 50S ribosomal protein L32 [Acidobacteriota bacterium]
MPNPRRRHSKARRDKRRTHDSLTAPNVVACPRCHESKLPHRVCPSCGYYEDREVIQVEEV